MFKILLFVYLFFFLACWKVLYSLCADAAEKANLLNEPKSKSTIFFSTLFVALVPIINIILLMEGIIHYDDVVEQVSEKAIDRQNKE